MNTIALDPRDPAFLANPYPVLRRLREEAPIHWWEEGRMWMLTRYADIESTLKDPRFTVDIRAWRLNDERGQESMPVEFKEMFEHGLFQVSRADHTRIRKLVAPSFTPRAAARQEGMIQEVVDELLAGVQDRDVVEFVQEFAEPMPIRVIARILGIPREHDEAFREWGQNLVKLTFPLLPPEARQAVVQRFPEGWHLLGELIEERRRHPGDDLLSSLLAAHEEGDKLSSVELRSLVGGLITAGSETTVHLLAYALLALLRRPETLARVRADLDLLPGTIEEVLRHDNFGLFGVPRYALERVTMHGTTIERGDMVMCVVNSAMHDRSVWPDAERFDIDRDPTLNLSFGRGAHFCLGAHLARAEARVALRTLLTRFPALSLAGEPSYHPHPFIRQVSYLVRFGQR